VRLNRKMLEETLYRVRRMRLEGRGMCEEKTPKQ